MRKLEALSYKDALTQLGNRFAMNNYVQQINKQHSIGIVYCDITGLKQENDTVGHQMGDQLILRASACLTKVFGDHGVFRIGGHAPKQPDASPPRAEVTSEIHAAQGL